MHLLQTNHSRPSIVFIRHSSTFVPLKATARFIRAIFANKPFWAIKGGHSSAFVPMKATVRLICAFVANKPFYAINSLY